MIDLNAVRGRAIEEIRDDGVASGRDEKILILSFVHLSILLGFRQKMLGKRTKGDMS
jgi:hypothetical protein